MKNSRGNIGRSGQRSPAIGFSGIAFPRILKKKRAAPRANAELSRRWLVRIRLRAAQKILATAAAAR
jgi:hypothetical protein